MKKCSKCEEIKSLDDFFKRTKSKDGRMSCCKQCKMEYTYLWRDKNKDKWNKYVSQNFQKRKQQYLTGQSAPKEKNLENNEYQIIGDVTHIKVGDKITLIDTVDIQNILDNQGKWVIKSSRRTYYAQRLNGFVLEKLHRKIMQLSKGDNLEVDHINHNGLDNRRINLRIATALENRRNLPIPKHNKSGVPGVIWHKGREEWRAYIKINGKHKQLVATSDFEEAVEVRQNALKQCGFHPNHCAL